MGVKTKYYIVAAEALPEIFIKVAEAKQRMQTGEAGTVGVRAQRHTAEGQTGSWQGRVMPAREGIWQEPLWEPAREAIRAEQKIRLHGAPSSPQPEGEEEEGTD